MIKQSTSNLSSLIKLYLLMMVFILNYNTSATAQDSLSLFNKSIFLSFQSSHYGNTVLKGRYEPIVMPAFEYRTQLKNFSPVFQLTWGLQLESFSIKTHVSEEEFFKDHDYILSIPLGLYYQLKSRTYIGGFVSFDIPFATLNRTEFQGMTFKHSEFNFRFLNIHTSTGFKIGQQINLKSHELFIEAHFKAIGVWAAKSNDYWPFISEFNQYHWGVKFGYSL